MGTQSTWGEKMRMKAVALLVVVAVAFIVQDSECAPISDKQGELLDNIESRAEEAVRNADRQTKKYNAEAAQARATSEANQKFAKDAAKDVALARQTLGQMQEEEAQIGDDMQKVSAADKDAATHMGTMTPGSFTMS